MHRKSFSRGDGASLKFLGALTPAHLCGADRARILSVARARAAAAGHPDAHIALEFKQGCLMVNMTLWGPGAPMEEDVDSSTSAVPRLQLDFSVDDLFAALPADLQALVKSSEACTLPAEAATLLCVAPGAASVPISLPLPRASAGTLTPAPRPCAWGPDAAEPLAVTPAPRRSGSAVEFEVALPSAWRSLPVLLTAGVEDDEGAAPVGLRRFLLLPAAVHRELLTLSSDERLAILDDLEGCLALAESETGAAVAALDNLVGFAGGCVGLEDSAVVFAALRTKLATPPAREGALTWALTFRSAPLEERYRQAVFAQRPLLVLKVFATLVWMNVLYSCDTKLNIVLSSFLLLAPLTAYVRARDYRRSNAFLLLFYALAKMHVMPRLTYTRMLLDPPGPPALLLAVAIAQTLLHYGLFAVKMRLVPFFPWSAAMCIIEGVFYYRIRTDTYLNPEVIRAGPEVVAASWPYSSYYNYFLVALCAVGMLANELRERKRFAAAASSTASRLPGGGAGGRNAKLD